MREMPGDEDGEPFCQRNHLGGGIFPQSILSDVFAQGGELRIKVSAHQAVASRLHLSVC